MKKVVRLLGAAALCGMMFACQNDDEPLQTARNGAPVQVVNLSDGKAVRVADDALTQAFPFVCPSSDVNTCL